MRATPNRSVAWLSAMATAVLIVAAACTTGGGASSAGADGSAAPGPSAAASPAASTGGGRYGEDYDDSYGGTATATPAASPGGAARVHTVAITNGRDGAYLTGEGGMTLYVFGNDSANTSTCEGDCAATWPPFTIAKGDSLEGAGGVTEPLTVITRSDGSLQVAYARSPLYYYAGDRAPGDTTGQGKGDVWFVAQP
jgi:predicted lipoprotein with Yx(FWY)xxD motif